MKPTKSNRTHLQIVVLAEETWLAPHLIETELYICPSEVMNRMKNAGGATC